MNNILKELISLANKLDEAGEIKTADKIDELIGGFNKLSFVRRRGNKWVVVSRKGKVLGTYDTKEKANERLRQIEFFKHNK